MVYLLVYGTLKKGYGNHGVLGRSKYINEAMTNSREFTMFDGGFPYVSDGFSDKSNGSILGELYQVDDQQILDNLDRLEGVPHLYVKREVDVTALDGQTYTATMYVASRGSNERLKDRQSIEPKGRSKILEWMRVVR
jgi:gamma-glutamylaminecyclotransferase